MIEGTVNSLPSERKNQTCMRERKVFSCTGSPEKEFEAGSDRKICASPVGCRICLETSRENLICPCDCKGSSMYVHENCLKTWVLSLSEVNKDFHRCEVCKSKYKIRFDYKLSCITSKVYILPLAVLLFSICFISIAAVYWGIYFGTQNSVYIALIALIIVMSATLFALSIYLIKYSCIKKTLVGVKHSDSNTTQIYL